MSSLLNLDKKSNKKLIYLLKNIYGIGFLASSKICSSLGYDVNIKSLAQSYSLSPWHFQRLFKSIVGSSLGQYTRGRRLTLAANMLLETDI